MRKIPVKLISECVTRLFIQANYQMDEQLCSKMQQALLEESGLARFVLSQLLDNYQLAKEQSLAICQDTGMSVVFIEIGQDVQLIDGDVETAINQGVAKAYEEGYLRKSVVDDPLFSRVNTKNNTPAMIHYKIVPGDRIKIEVTPKGFGSENMSVLKMLIPSDGVEGVKQVVLDAVLKAGPNACPPLVIGIGIGGTMEVAAQMAKYATIRNVKTYHADPQYAALEHELEDAINNLKIGPGGFGGNTTCLKVSIDYAPTHIAGLPVAVNICCHAARHAGEVL
jgi:fumarate hydratase subunit alpha